MFKETMDKIRDMVAELDDDLPCSLTVREFAEDIQKELDELIEFREQLGKKMDEKDERIEELDSIIEELNRNLDSANRENNELRRELNKKANRLHDEIANKDDRIEALVNENDILSKTVGELERERRVIIPCKLIDELQAAKEKVEELEKQIKEKDECIRKKANNIERLDRALEIYCNRVHELSVGNDNLRKDNKELVERIEKLEQEKERTVVPSKLIDELQAAREKVEELTKHNDDLRRENKFLGRRIEEKNERLLQLERDSKAANQRFYGR